MSAGRGMTIALAVGVLACAAAVAPAAGQQREPDKVIDAKSDAQAAGQTLDLCATLSNCQWVTEPNGVSGGYGPPRILGDVLYNCSADSAAETADELSDEREETTSLSESVSVKASLGFLDLAKESVEFKLFSNQASSFGTSVSSTHAVSVAPKWKGWVQTRILSANVSGSTYVTDGIQLIQVTGMDLTFPGYRTADQGTNTSVRYDLMSGPMSQDDIDTQCTAISGRTPTAVRPSAFRLSVCEPGPDADCDPQRVTGVLPPRIRQGTAAITQGGRTVATGTVSRGRIEVTPRRPLEAGRYRLVLTEAVAIPKRQLHRTKRTSGGRRLTKAERRPRTWERHRMHTRIPIKIS